VINPSKPLRIVHVVGTMNRGGIETWLMNVLRQADRRKYQHEFIVHNSAVGAYDAEILRLGSRVQVVRRATNPITYVKTLSDHLRRHGPYDVVHSHVHHFSGVVLAAAHLAAVTARIAHSHTDTLANDGKASLVRRCYIKATNSLIRRHATLGLAASANAGEALFRWPRTGRCPWQVLHYGIDLKPFAAPIDKQTVRHDLGLPADGFVVGHVGNLLPVKNHHFLIGVFAEIARDHPKAMLLLIGEGPLRPQLEAQVAVLGLSSRVVFAGARPNVSELLRAVDVFVFPSLWEGLGLAVIEAQAAGLPVVLSDRVPQEADVVPELIRRLDPDVDARTWSKACLDVATAAMPAEGYRRVGATDFCIARSVAALHEVYESCRVTNEARGEHANYVGVN
jgi:glycosyltransferase involved in cell wall biosynthesis